MTAGSWLTAVCEDGIQSPGVTRALPSQHVTSNTAVISQEEGCREMVKGVSIFTTPDQQQNSALSNSTNKNLASWTTANYNKRRKLISILAVICSLWPYNYGRMGLMVVSLTVTMLVHLIHLWQWWSKFNPVESAWKFFLTTHAQIICSSTVSLYQGLYIWGFLFRETWLLAAWKYRYGTKKGKTHSGISKHLDRELPVISLRT